MTDVVVEGDAPPWTLTDRLRKAREHRGLERRTARPRGKSDLLICYLCSHLHDYRDELLAVPGVCMWCAEDRPCPGGETPKAFLP